MSGDRMLHAGAQPAEDQRAGQHCELDARPGGEIADAGTRGAKTEDQRSAETLGDDPGRHLKARHRADIERTQSPDLG